MKELKKLSLNEEVKREAEQIEKEVESRSDLDDIEVSDDMEASLFNKIQEYEYDKRLKKVHYRRKRRYIIAALAAVIVLVCGSVMTGVGSKSYWKVIWERIAGDGATAITNVEDMDSHETEDIDIVSLYQLITVLNGKFINNTQDKIEYYIELHPTESDDWFKNIQEAKGDNVERVYARPTAENLRVFRFSMDREYDCNHYLLQFVYDKRSGIVLKMRVIEFERINRTFEKLLKDGNGVIRL